MANMTDQEGRPYYPREGKYSPYHKNILEELGEIHEVLIRAFQILGRCKSTLFSDGYGMLELTDYNSWPAYSYVKSSNINQPVTDDLVLSYKGYTVFPPMRIDVSKDTLQSKVANIRAILTGIPGFLTNWIGLNYMSTNGIEYKRGHTYNSLCIRYREESSELIELEFPNIYDDISGMQFASNIPYHPNKDYI